MRCESEEERGEDEVGVEWQTAQRQRGAQGYHHKPQFLLLAAESVVRCVGSGGEAAAEEAGEAEGVEAAAHREEESSKGCCCSCGEGGWGCA